MFILTEHTPNPDALKFVPDAALTGGTSRWCASGADGPLAARLFALAGVRRVFIAPAFVTVTRTADGPAWPELRYAVIAALGDHLATGEPALADEAPAEAEALAEDEIVSEIREVLGRHVRPGVARDGGDVVLERFEPATGVVWVRLQGACGGCPSARLTLKSGIERVLRRFVPEVLRVEEIVGEPPDAAGSRWTQWAKRGGTASPQRARTVFTHAGRAIKAPVS